jgi:AraC-like DNA-binding protein
MVSGFSSVKHLSNFTLTQFSQATGLTSTEVAEQCGFSDAFHLSMRVKDRTGIAPRELRKTEQATGQ